jgi:elongation factor P
MLDFSDIKLGKVIDFNNQPCAIIKCEFLRMQQRKPVKKCIMKNLITGNNVDYSFKSGESVDEADIKKSPASYMYQEGENLNFMLNETYETVEIPIEMMSGKEGYLKEGLEVSIVYFNDQPITVDLPIKVSYQVAHTTEAAKGNTVSNVMKDATIETGMEIKVPSFISTGEKIIMNTVEDEYVERDTNS